MEFRPTVRGEVGGYIEEVSMEKNQSGRLGRSRKPLWALRPPWVRISPSPLEVGGEVGSS